MSPFLITGALKERISISISIKCTQFLLTLAWASTVHKVQALGLEKGVIDLDLKKNKNHLGQGKHKPQSRVKTDNNFYCVGKIKKSAIKVIKVALLEHEPLKQNDLFTAIKQKHYFRRYHNSSCSKCKITFRTCQ